MSVLVRGMEMPESCKDCPCAYYTEGAHHDFCQVIGFDSDIKYESGWKLDNCPLVEIPTPHGKLVDKQEIIRNSSNSWTKDDWFNSVVNAPTVIEAEDGEE